MNYSCRNNPSSDTQVLLFFLPAKIELDS